MMRHSRGLDCGFTLIEMIGVLAVIAVLAALLIPKNFESINSARLNQAVLSCQTIKTAVLDHYGKFQSLASSNGVPLATLPNDNFDAVLLAEGLIDKPFDSKIGVMSLIRLRNVDTLSSSASVDPANSQSGYDLDGDGVNDILGAHYLVEAVIFQVSDADARTLNEIIDGPQLGETTSGQDFKGRVTYHKMSGSNPLVVRIYLTHN